MSKVIRLEISRKTYTTLSVLVPDDFDLGQHNSRLHRHPYTELLRELADGADFEEPHGEPIEVESVQPLEGEEAQQELRDYAVTDIGERLKVCEATELEWEAKAKALQAAKKGTNP